MGKRILSIILAIMMVVPMIGTTPVIAEGEPVDITEIKEFEEIVKILSEKRTNFKDEDDVKYYRKTYWDGVFPAVNDLGHDFNTDAPLTYNINYYGHAGLIPSPPNRTTDGQKLYLGFTKDGRTVTNIMHPEDDMAGPKLILNVRDPEVYNAYTGLVKPYLTDYNDPKKVGKMYLGEDVGDNEALNLGNEILEMWAKKLKNRLGYYYGGKDFHEIYSTDEILTSFAITVPPTSRSEGQAVGWFTTTGPVKYTHRTFYIEKTDPFNLKVTGYEFNPDTKNLRINYTIEGWDKVEGESNFTLMLLDFDTKTSAFKDSPTLGVGERYSTFFKNDPISVIEIHKDINIANQFSSVGRDQYVDINLSGVIDDENFNRLTFAAFVNTAHEYSKTDPRYNPKGFIEYSKLVTGSRITYEDDSPYDDNILTGVLFGNNLDFTIDEPETLIIGDGDEELEIELTGRLVNSMEDYTTTISLYDEDGNLLDEIDNVKFDVDFNKSTGTGRKDDTQTVTFEVDTEDFEEGDNLLYAVINSDFDLTEATPIDVEPNFSNNKVEILISKSVDADFEIETPSTLTTIEKDSVSSVDIDFWVALANTADTINTRVTLYNKSGTQIGSKNISLEGGESTI